MVMEGGMKGGNDGCREGSGWTGVEQEGKGGSVEQLLRSTLEKTWHCQQHC